MRGGQPCGDCDKSGGGMGKLGQGRGGKATEEQANVGFKTERGKVHTGKGAIVGQFLVDGEQIKGDVNSNLVELVSAAERDASDRINHDRIPRQYHKAVKAYFSNIQRTVVGKDKEPGSPSPGESPAGGDKSPKGDAGPDE